MCEPKQDGVIDVSRTELAFIKHSKKTGFEVVPVPGLGLEACITFRRRTSIGLNKMIDRVSNTKAEQERKTFLVQEFVTGFRYF